MQVRFLTSVFSNGEFFKAGSVAQMPDKVAQGLIKSLFAAQEKVEKAVPQASEGQNVAPVAPQVPGQKVESEPNEKGE